MTWKLIAVPFLAILSGCSSTEPLRDARLITSETRVLTVAEASEVWRGLSLRERVAFQRHDNPAEAFVHAMAGKMAVDLHLDGSPFLADPEVTSFADSWLRVESSALARRLLVARERDALVDSDLELYKNHRGVTVWFTTESTGPMMDMPLHALPRDLAQALSELSPGQESIFPDYGLCRLDSLHRIPFESLDPLEPDSVIAENLAVGRERFRYILTYLAFSKDPATLVRFPWENPDAADTVVVSYSGGRWTRSQIEREFAFLQSRIPGATLSPEWLGIVAENLIMQTHYAAMLTELHPLGMDSLRTQQSRFLRGVAADLMLRSHLDTAVVFSRAELEREYDLLRDSSADSLFPTLEEMEGELRTSALARLEGEAAERLVARLREQHQVLIHLDVLQSLPSDPALWP